MRQVLLFSGHIIDAPDRQPPRFPNEKASIAGQRIAAAGWTSVAWRDLAGGAVALHRARRP